MKKERMDRDREQRKCQSNLRIISSGFILLAFWDILKTVAGMVFTDSMGIAEIPPEDRIAVLIMAIIMVGIFVAIDLKIRFFIARRARAEARGERPGFMYIVWIAIICLLSALAAAGSVYELVNGIEDPNKIADTAAYLFMDVTMTIISAEFIYSAIRLRRIKKEKEVTENAA